MGIKEDILQEFETQKKLTVRDLAEALNKSDQTIRSVINRNLSEKLEEIPGECKNKFKVYKLANGNYESNMNHRILHNKIDKLENFKKESIEKLKFLMDFFQLNSKILMKSNKSFFAANRENFRDIAKIIQGGSHGD